MAASPICSPVDSNIWVLTTWYLKVPRHLPLSPSPLLPTSEEILCCNYWPNIFNEVNPPDLRGIHWVPGPVNGSRVVLLSICAFSIHSSRQERNQRAQIFHFHLLAEPGFWYPWKSVWVDHQICRSYQIMYLCQSLWLSGISGYTTHLLWTCYIWFTWNLLIILRYISFNNSPAFNMSDPLHVHSYEVVGNIGHHDWLTHSHSNIHSKLLITSCCDQQGF